MPLTLEVERNRNASTQQFKFQITNTFLNFFNDRVVRARLFKGDRVWLARSAAARLRIKTSQPDSLHLPPQCNFVLCPVVELISVSELFTTERSGQHKLELGEARLRIAPPQAKVSPVRCKSSPRAYGRTIQYMRKEKEPSFITTRGVPILGLLKTPNSFHPKNLVVDRIGERTRRFQFRFAVGSFDRTNSSRRTGI